MDDVSLMDAQSKIRTKLLGILLIALPAAGTLCIDMYLPAYNSMAHTFHVSAGVINLSIAIYLIGFALGQLIYGPLADRFGRKKPLIAGLILFAIASLICVFAPNFDIFLVGRLLQAIGVSSSMVLCATIITDLYAEAKRTRMLALTLAVKIISPTLAPLLGGLIIAKFHWQVIFLVLALIGSLMLIAVFYLIPKTTAVQNKNALQLSLQYMNLKRVLKNRLFIGYSIGLGLVYAVIYAWITLSPGLLITHFHVSPQHFGLYYMFPALGATIGALTIAKFSNKCCLIKHSFMALSITTLFVLLFALLHNHIATPLILVLLVAGIFFGCGMCRPLLTSGALGQFADIRGFSSSIIGFIQTIFGAAMGLITGIIYHVDMPTTILLLLIPAVLALLAYAYAVLKVKHIKLLLPRYAS